MSSTLFVFSVFGEDMHFEILVCLRKIGIVMGDRHNFLWNKHLHFDYLYSCQFRMKRFSLLQL